MNWDDRRKLAKDLSTRLSPADLIGVLVRIYKDPSSKINEYLQKGEIYMESMIDLDSLSNEVLKQLREYVDECCLTSLTESEECVICEGLWSCDQVVACGNDGCKTKVHETCFGVVLRKYQGGPWLCPSCQCGQDLSCVICLQQGGALKPTTDGRWTHLLCALVIPETTVYDVPCLEPVEGLNEIHNTRFRFVCNICKQRGGACVVCESSQCNLGFHPQCAADAGLLVGTELNPMALFCDKHLPEDRIPNAKRWISEDDCLPEFMENEELEPLADVVMDEESMAVYNNLAESNSNQQEKKLDTLAKLKAGIPLSRPKSPIISTTTTGEMGPEFPKGKELVGAIVEVYRKDDNRLYRGQVMEWSSRNRNYRVSYFIENFEEWVRLRPHGCRVLQLLSERLDPSGIRIRLVRKHSHWMPQEHFYIDSIGTPRNGSKKQLLGTSRRISFF